MDGLSEAKKELEEKNVRFVYFQFVDLNGALYSTTVDVDRLDEAGTQGIGIDGYSCGFLEVEKSDLIIRPDPETMVILPWETAGGKVASFICDIYEVDGETEYSLNPRAILKAAIENLKKDIGRDAEFIVSPELQFWVMVKKDGHLVLYDNAGYFSPPPHDKADDLRQEIVVSLRNAGLYCNKSHHETTEGKYELNIDHGSALKIADRMLQYKFIVRNIAARHGLLISFMPKPFGDRAGNGMHFHQNLTLGGKNLFSDRQSKYFGLSQVALNFIAGQLKHARALVSITNPTVNSYKRFHQLTGAEAPSYVLWAQYNRTCLLRIPPCSPEAARFEFRGSDGSTNPYLGFAAFLMSGLDGIRNEITPPEPVEENVHSLTSQQKKDKYIFELPWNLGEALEELKKDEVMKGALGPAYKRFIFLKTREWREYGRLVTPWEIEKYFDL